jgi:glycine betaine/proline transport system permease protein
MISISMIVISSTIGLNGLEFPILRSITNQYLAIGSIKGLAIVALAIIFDHISQNYAKKMEQHKEVLKK